MPIYNNKGDIKYWKNYCEIKFMSHKMKFWERIIEQKIKHETNVSKN